MTLPSTSVTVCIACCQEYLCIWCGGGGYSPHFNFLKLYSSITFIDALHETQDFLLYFLDLCICSAKLHILRWTYRSYIDPKLSWVSRTKKERPNSVYSQTSSAPFFSQGVKCNQTKPQRRDKSSGNYFLILGVIDCPPDLLDWRGG